MALEKKEEEGGNRDAQRNEDEVAPVVLDTKVEEGANGEDQVVVDIQGEEEASKDGAFVLGAVHEREREEGRENG